MCIRDSPKSALEVNYAVIRTNSPKSSMPAKMIIRVFTLPIIIYSTNYSRDFKCILSSVITWANLLVHLCHAWWFHRQQPGLYTIQAYIMYLYRGAGTGLVLALCLSTATRPFHHWVKPGFHSNAIACVSCGFRLRNASDCVWMETGLNSSMTGAIQNLYDSISIVVHDQLSTFTTELKFSSLVNVMSSQSPL